MAFNIFRIDWGKRKKALDKASRKAGKLAIDFRNKAKQAQKLAYRLETAIARSKLKKAKSAGADAVSKYLKGREGEGGARLVKDKRKIEEFIRQLASFASTANSIGVFFTRIRTIVRRIEKSHKLAKKLRGEKKRLAAKLSAKKKIIKRKKKLRKKKSKSDAKALRQEIKILEIERKEIKDELSDTKKMYKNYTKDYERLKKEFKDEHKVAKDLISDMRESIKSYRRYVKWLGKQPGYKKFAKSFYSRKLKKDLKGLKKAMRKYRWA